MDARSIYQFFAQQQDRMDLPDEDVQAYIARRADRSHGSNRGDRAQSPLQTVKDTADGPSSPSPVTEQPRHTQPTGRDIDSAGRLSQPQDSATEHHSTVQESKQVHSSGKRKSPDHTTALDGPSCKKLRKDARIVTNGSSEQQSASSVPVVAIPEERRGVRSSSTITGSATAANSESLDPGDRAGKSGQQLDVRPSYLSMPPPPVPLTALLRQTRQAETAHTTGSLATTLASRTYADSARHRATAPAPPATHQEPAAQTPAAPAAKPTNVLESSSSPIECTPPERPALAKVHAAREPPAHGAAAGHAQAGKGTRKRITAGEWDASGAPGRPSAAEPIRFSFLTGEGSALHLRDLQRRQQAQNAGPSKKKAAKKTKKQLGGMRPADYAEYMRTVWTEDALKGRPAEDMFLKGKSIFYCDTDHNLATVVTKNHLEALARHGATIIPKYDPTKVTHIVTNAYKRLFLEKVGLKSVDEVPSTIPILRWEWVISGRRKRGLGRWHEHPTYTDHLVFEPEMSEEEKQEVLADLQRKKTSTSTVKPKEKVVIEDPNDSDYNEDAEISKISEFTEDGPSTRRAVASGLPSDDIESFHSTGDSSRILSAQDTKSTKDDSHISSSSKTMTKDPLAEFYDLARAERDAETEHTVPGSSKRKGALGGFQCDALPTGKDQAARCPNQDVIDKLAELKELHANKIGAGDSWRVYSYNKAIGSLRKYPTRIKTYEEALAIPGVGSKTAEKIMEIIDTGNLRRIQYERTQDVEVVRTFMGIYGVGAKTAHQWYAAGCRTLDDLRNGTGGVKLSDVQQIGLKYYDDINARMPRQEAGAIYAKIKEIALGIDPKLFIEIMGSFRRGKDTCGDIDILISRPTGDGQTHEGVLRKLLTKLHERGIVTDDLSLPDDWTSLELMYRGLCRKDSHSPRRRIDFLTVPYTSKGAALLYYTGDDIFNRSMRLKANKMGYSLNQRGLYGKVIRDPSDRQKKLNNGVIIASETEEAIFEKLGVPWQEPHQRIRGA